MFSLHTLNTMESSGFYSLRSLNFLEIIALMVDHRQKNWSISSRALDSSGSVVPVALYYWLTLWCGAYFVNGPLVLDYFNRIEWFYLCDYILNFFNLHYFMSTHLSAVNSSRSFSNSCVTKCCDRISDDKWATLRASVTTCDSSL